MDLGNKINDIRKASGLTQEEFAQKLFVTRQAVSRWENGETTPTLDTLKTICGLFKTDANAFFETQQAPICQSCAMSLISLDDLATNDDKTVNMDFCVHCFKDGSYTHDRTLEEMIETNLKFLAEFNAGNGTDYTEEETRNILKLYLPTLKRWAVDKHN